MKKVLIYGVPILFFMMFVVFMVFFARNSERNYYNEHSENIFNGKVIEAKPYGKGAYHYVVKGMDKNYGLTFNRKENILVDDSILKNKFEPYIIYRKNNNHDYILADTINYY